MLEWENEIDEHLHSAQIILLLVRPDFIASDYCYGKEMQKALERHKLDEARVTPIIFRSVQWKETPLGKLQALPTDALHVTSWSNLDEALQNVTSGIRKVAEKLRSQQAKEINLPLNVESVVSQKSASNTSRSLRTVILPMETSA